MQVSFSHVGTGGARKAPPLSLGTWPSEGEGYADALRWYTKVQSALQPLRGRVGSKDTRVQKVKLGCQQAAKAACARADLAKVCLVLNVSALCSAYPQPTLYPRILSHTARGDGGGGDAAAAVLCGAAPTLGLRTLHTHSVLSLSSAYPQPTLSLPSHAFLLGRLVALLLLAIRVIATSIASTPEARLQAVRQRRSQRRHRRPSCRGRQHRQGQGWGRRNPNPAH